MAVTENQHDILEQLISFLQKKGGAAGNGKIVSVLKFWQSKPQFLEWRKPYLDSGILVKRRGKGGATALPSKSKRKSNHENISVDARRLLDFIPPDGSPIGNTRLQAKFGKSGDEYWRIRKELLDAKYIETGRGRGGSVSRTETTLSPLFEKQSDLVEEEKDLYEPLKKWLEDTWGREAKEVGDYNFAKVTASASGRKRNSGQWSRPDVTFVRVNNFDYLPGVSVEVSSFEVKPYRTSKDLASLYEAAAHSRYAHNTYLVVEASGQGDDSYETIEKECARLNVGLIKTTKIDGKREFKEILEPTSGEPAQLELNNFLKEFYYTDETQLRLFRQAIRR